jgi:hypothetical protein
MAAIGGLAATAALFRGPAVLAISGLLVTALATIAIVLHRRLGEGPLRSHAARTARLRAEQMSWCAALAVSATLVVIGGHIHPPKGIPISGMPKEIRSWPMIVIMPDGRTYRFVCGSEWRRGRHGYCPALKKWRELPPWPEPRRFEMKVAGARIVSLHLDGKVIVDPQVDNSGKLRKAALVLGGFGLGAAAARAVWRRARQLRKLGAAKAKKGSRQIDSLSDDCL